MTWDEVARRIGDGAAAILPIGAAAKQHGFHLPLNTDRIQAEWLAAALAERIDALIWPTLSLRLLSGLRRICRQQQPVGCDVRGCRASRSRRKFSAAVAARCSCSTPASARCAPVERALARLDTGNVLHLRIHEGPRYRRAAEQICRAEPWQPCRRTRDLADAGAGAAIWSTCRAPKRAPPLNTKRRGRLTPTDTTSPNYSRSGSYGDPTLATRAKGEALARGDARRSHRAGRGVPRADRRRQPIAARGVPRS